MFLFVLCLFQKMHTCFIEHLLTQIRHWVTTLWNKYDRFWTERKKRIVLNELILHCFEKGILKYIKYDIFASFKS